MSAAGQERVDRAISELLDSETELLDALSQADQDRLAGLLRKLSLDFD
jgi:hypothetical protein